MAELPVWAQIIQIGGWVTAAIAAGYGVIRGVSEARRTRQVREQELNWKRARAAAEALAEMKKDPECRDALRMLDWEGLTFGREDGPKFAIWHAGLIAALRTDNLAFTADELFVRNCFDSLFDHLSQIQWQIDLEIIRHSDIATPLGYYARLKVVREHWAVFKNFGLIYGNPGAITLLRNLEAGP